MLPRDDAPPELRARDRLRARARARLAMHPLDPDGPEEDEAEALCELLEEDEHDY